ncbi:MAG: 30S ribosomal protein S18 [Candidatus Omnitrophota bacterium]
MPPRFGRDKDKPKKREPGKKRVFRRKPCKFCIEKVEKLDYLDYGRFQKFITERGKIIPSRISGSCAKHQRQLARAVKKARIASLLPFVAE